MKFLSICLTLLTLNAMASNTLSCDVQISLKQPIGNQFKSLNGEDILTTIKYVTDYNINKNIVINNNKTSTDKPKSGLKTSKIYSLSFHYYSSSTTSNSTVGVKIESNEGVELEFTRSMIKEEKNFIETLTLPNNGSFYISCIKDN